ncbi:MAG: HesA/MoeB/ThiF family protein [Bacillota bacterium]
MLTEMEQLRYARQLVIPTIGTGGQERLKAARVLIIGAGGLGSPVALYLAAAGVGTLGIVDSDCVDLTNLQRQILHGESTQGRPKVESASERLHQLNSGITIRTHRLAVERGNVEQLVSAYDLVVDAVDSLETRFTVNDACVSLGKPLVEAGVSQFTGMIMSIIPGQGACYRCVFPTPPPPGSLPTPAQLGILGSVAGLAGCIQATEAIKLLIGAGEPLVNRMLWIDALKMNFDMVQIARDPACPTCGSRH